MTSAIALALCLGCQHSPAATGRLAAWQLRGAIVAADSGRLQVRHKSGQIVDLVVDDETVFVSGDRVVTTAALHIGARVVVEVEPIGGGRQRARRVRVSGV